MLSKDLVSTNEGDTTHNAAVLLTTMKNLANQEISCKPRWVPTNLPSLPELEKHFRRPSPPGQSLRDSNCQTLGSILVGTSTHMPRTLEYSPSLTTAVSSVNCENDISRIRTVSMDSHHSESDTKCLLNNQEEAPIKASLAQVHESFASEPNVHGIQVSLDVSPSSPTLLHVIPTDPTKSPKRTVDRRKRYLDAQKDEEGLSSIAECCHHDHARDESVPNSTPKQSKKQKTQKSTPPSILHSSTKEQDLNGTSEKDAKAIILRKKFSWKNYPELENFLIANREEYLRHSALNYTMEQKQYNNKLTERLIELASECGYMFDQDTFTFVSIRDRIRCYFKSYVQSRKKRGVIIGYAAKKAGLLDEKQLEKNIGTKAKIVSISKRSSKK